MEEKEKKPAGSGIGFRQGAEAEGGHGDPVGRLDSGAVSASDPADRKCSGRPGHPGSVRHRGTALCHFRGSGAEI